MKVAINILTENPHRPTGALGYYQNLVPSLAGIAPDDEFYLLVSPGIQRYFPYGSPNVRNVVLPFSNERQKFRVLSEHLMVPGIMMRNGIDVLNTGNIAPFYVPRVLVATIKTMHAFTTPADLPASVRIYRRVVGRLTARRANVVIANSVANKKDIVSYFKVEPGKVRIVYEAVDHERFFPVEERGPILDRLGRLGIRPPYLLFVSSLWRYKNVEVLLRAFRTARESYTEHTLVIAGHVPDPDYKSRLVVLAGELGLSEHVSFIGGVAHEETPWLYRGADMLVYPSRYETFGLPLPEAMACGCPVIVSNVSSLPEIAGDAALKFEPEDDGELADCIRQVLRMPSFREELVQKGFKRAREFSWRQTAHDTLEAYQAALAG